MHAVAEGETAADQDLEEKGPRQRSWRREGTSSRTVGLLGAIFTYAVRKRLRSDNPVRGVIRFADGKRERRLSDAEYKALW